MKKSTIVQLNTSFLDKLIDNEPSSKLSQSTNHGLNLSDLRMSLVHDLENLLNNKIQWKTWPAWNKDLEISLLNYGLGDFSGIVSDNETNQIALCKQIKKTIKHFEPRLSDVNVDLIEHDKDIKDRAGVNITAVLYADSDPEYISFNVKIEQSYLGISITENMT